MIKYGNLMKGYKKGVVEFIPNPDGDGKRGVVCRIGDNWFHFGGQEAEVCTPPEYLRNVGTRPAIRCLYEALNGRGGMREADPDEYAYYEAVLVESGCVGEGDTR